LQNTEYNLSQKLGVQIFLIFLLVLDLFWSKCKKEL